MKSIYLLILGLFISSAFFICCTTKVKFGVSQKLISGDYEQEGDLNQTIVEKYETIINTDTLNIPLNKYIFSEKYKIYIGVSFTADAGKLYEIFNNNDSYLIYNYQNNSDTTSLLFKKDMDFFYSFIYNSSKDKLTYILTLESDSITVRSKYNQHFLENKLPN